MSLIIESYLDRIVTRLERIVVLLEAVKNGQARTETRLYSCSWYHPRSTALSLSTVRAYSAADAIAQVENSFRGMFPAPLRVHHVEPAVPETEVSASRQSSAVAPEEIRR